MTSWVFVCLAFPTLIHDALAHQGHHHLQETQKIDELKDSDRDAKLRKIGSEYAARIEPLFRKACFDCHSTQTHYPWYSKLPFVRNMIESDIAESRKHLDFTVGFPFKSHGTPEEDLEAIAKSVSEGDMPPFRYRLFHPDASLGESEKETIKRWAVNGLSTLGSQSKPPR